MPKPPDKARFGCLRNYPSLNAKPTPYNRKTIGLRVFSLPPCPTSAPHSTKPQATSHGYPHCPEWGLHCLLSRNALLVMHELRRDEMPLYASSMGLQRSLPAFKGSADKPREPVTSSSPCATAELPTSGNRDIVQQLLVVGQTASTE